MSSSGSHTIDWSSATSLDACADIYLMGLVDCDTMDTLLTIASGEVARQQSRKAQVLICEHPPTVTLGCDCQGEPLPVPLRELQSRRIPVVSVHRGGRAILHAPGQLSVYVTTSLKRIDCNPIEFRRQLERAVVKTCEDFQLVAHRNDAVCGVSGRDGMICESAVRETDAIGQGMLFLNVLEPSVDYFATRNLTGSQSLSSMNSERTSPVPMPAVRTSLMRHLCEVLQLPGWNIHTRHPALTRTMRKCDEQPPNR